MKQVFKKCEGSIVATGAGILGLISAVLSIASVLGTFGMMSAVSGQVCVAEAVGALLLARGAVGLWETAGQLFLEANQATSELEGGQESYASHH